MCNNSCRFIIPALPQLRIDRKSVEWSSGSPKAGMDIHDRVLRHAIPRLDALVNTVK